jgi:hypothetical protein
MTKMRHGKMTHWSKGGEVKEEAKEKKAGIKESAAQEKAEKMSNGGSVKARMTAKSHGKAWTC